MLYTEDRWGLEWLLDLLASLFILPGVSFHSAQLRLESTNIFSKGNITPR
jgi:hypothetical protein